MTTTQENGQERTNKGSQKGYNPNGEEIQHNETGSSITPERPEGTVEPEINPKNNELPQEKTPQPPITEAPKLDLNFKLVNNLGNANTDSQEEWHKELNNQVNKISNGLGVKVNTVQTTDELPKNLQTEIKNQKVENKINGLYDNTTGEIYLISDKIKSTQDARESMLHEAVGHKGLRLTLGENFNKMLDDIYPNIPKDLHDEIENKYTKTNTDGTVEKPDKYTISEEYLAQMAQKDEKPTFIQNAISKVRDIVRNVFGLKYSDNDINRLFQLSKEALKSNQSPKILSDYTNPDLHFHIKFSTEDMDKLFKQFKSQNELNGLSQNRDRGFYNKLGNHIEDESAKKGVDVTAVASKLDLPTDVQKTNETEVTDPETGRNFVAYLQAKIISIMNKNLSLDESVKSKKSYTDIGNKLADKVLKVKISRPAMFMVSTPASLVWDASVDIVAKTLREGGKLIDAINNGIENMKKSDWYKKLPGWQQSVAKNQFKEHHYNLFKTNVTLEDLQNEFGNKKGNKFTMPEVIRIFDYARAKYINDRYNQFGDVVDGVAKDVGLSPEQILSAFSEFKGARELIDELFLTMRKRRSIQAQSVAWILFKDKGGNLYNALADYLNEEAAKRGTEIIPAESPKSAMVTPERKKELRKLFDKQVKELAEKYNLTETEVLLLLKDLYENGTLNINEE